jgi:hypothetical protein
LTADELYRLAVQIVLAAFGFVISVAIGVIGYFLRHLHERVDAHIAETERESRDFVERVARVEEATKGLGAQLKTIDAKLDRLIERGHP